MFGSPRKPAAPAAPVPPAPPALTKEDIAAAVGGAIGGIKTELENKIAELRGVVQEVSGRQQTVVVQDSGASRHADVPTPGITDAEIEDAVRTGEGAAAKLRALVDGAVNAATAQTRAELANFQAIGLQSLAQVAGEIAVTKMPHYKRFQKEIDDRVARLEPALRANPDAIRMIHDAVVGQHTAELLREAEEAAIRRAQDQPTGQDPAAQRDTAPARGGNSGNTPGGRAPSDADGRKVPTIAELGGDDGMEALKFKDGRSGKDADSFAQSLGYADWKHYMDEFEKAKAEGEKMGVGTS